MRDNSRFYEKASVHVKHYRRKVAVSYPATGLQKFYTLFLAPLITLAFIYIVFSFLHYRGSVSDETISLNDLILASGATLLRLFVAYVISVVLAFPLAMLAVYNRFFEAVLLPVFDIIESVPVLALFPIAILLFVQFGDINGAAIFILVLSMVWSIVFTLVGGLKIIPKDIHYAAKIFGIKGWSYFKKVLLPGVFPELVTGSIIAVGAAWNLTIVAEALHTYIPGGLESDDLFGIGSIMVHASAHGDSTLFLASVTVMITLIAVVNIFVWQKLLRFAEKFRFD